MTAGGQHRELAGDGELTANNDPRHREIQGRKAAVPTIRYSDRNMHFRRFHNFYKKPALGLAMCLFSIFISRTSVATLIDQTSIGLTPAQRHAVETTSCKRMRNVEAENIEAFRENGPRSLMTVTVRCRAHGSVMGQSIRLFTSCEKAVFGWRCDPGTDYLELNHSGATVYLATGTNVSSNVTLQIVQAILDSSPVGGHHMVAMLDRSQCSVRATMQNKYEVWCGLAIVSVSQKCTDDQCSYHTDLVSVGVP